MRCCRQRAASGTSLAPTSIPLARVSIMPVTHVSTAMLLQGQQYNLKVQPHDTAGAKLQGGKLRLDAYLAAALAAGNAASRAKVQEAIKAGLVSINGKQANKASCAVRWGDQVQATLLPAPTLQSVMPWVAPPPPLPSPPPPHPTPPPPHPTPPHPTPPHPTPPHPTPPHPTPPHPTPPHPTPPHPTPPHPTPPHPTPPPPHPTPPHPALSPCTFWQPAGMPVHTSAGHHSGTLVNALLHHWGLPGILIDPSQPSALPLPADSFIKAEDEDDSLEEEAEEEEEEEEAAIGPGQAAPLLLPQPAASPQTVPGQSSPALHGKGEAVDWAGVVGGAGGAVREAGGPSSCLGARQLESPPEAVLLPGPLEGLGPGAAAGAVLGSSSSSSSEWQQKQQQVQQQQEQQQQQQWQQQQQQQQQQWQQQQGVVRPGIVHRLDLGTTGLLVVAKREAALRHLCHQFKQRTASGGVGAGAAGEAGQGHGGSLSQCAATGVGRVYCSITLGCPHPASGRVLTNIDRDPGERKRMAAFPYGSTQGRLAASNYLVLQSLAGGAAALVQWRLETGRTHQIRVHGKHLGHPLLGDATYGGAGVAAVNAMGRCNPSRQQDLRSVVMPLSRPTLHAKSLAFEHPATGQRLEFESQLPKDFQELLQSLQQLD
ncbi:hypothetical protein QJQ45_020287 [Haematococcus lacustris]|nr:hypothetical protein QJQ45_020287 [Haematococcus lacustris]